MRCRTTPPRADWRALEAAGLLPVDEAAPPLVRMDWVVQAAIRAAMPPGVLDGTADADALLAAWLLGVAHRDAVAIRGRLGRTRLRGGKGDAVGPLLGANHQVTPGTTLTLANAYHSVGHLTDAVRLLKDTVQRCEQSLPESDPFTAAARDGLAAMRGGR